MNVADQKNAQKKTKKSLKQSVVFSLTFLCSFFILLSTSSCQGLSGLASKFSSQNSGGGPNPGSPGSPTGPIATNTPIPQVAISPVPSQEMNLGVSMTVPVNFQSLNGYTGTATLSLVTKMVNANDPMGTITFSISPSSVDLSSGSGSAMVTVTSTSASPDLVGSFQVQASTPNGQVLGSVPLTIKPVFEVDIIDAGDLDTTGIENWSIPGGTTTNFTAHPAGVTVNFCNKDTVEKSGFYRVHSSGTAFLHQGSEGLGLPDTTTPDVNDGTSAKSTLIASTLGPCYTVEVLSQVAKLKNTYYDHNNENAGKAGRNMIFNAFTAPPKIGNSGNPNASFAYIQKNLITQQCMTCHVTNIASEGNGIDLSTYTAVLTQVQAGSALGSPFYVQIAPGGTMPQGAPGTVSSTLVQDVEDWINDGALNN